MPRLSFIRIAVVSSLVAVLSYAATAETFEPNAGDTIVWAGDSITHQSGYTQYLENFLYTRFHDKKLRFANAGIRGDDAGDLLDRFDEDIKQWNPQWVTVLLGMNDGRYAAFQRENFQLYQRDMIRVSERLEAIGSKAILLSPTMFDHQQYNFRNDEPDFRFKRLKPSPEYNAKLAFYGGWLRELAREKSLAYVDLWGPMNDFTARGRIGDPCYTLMPDSIHPNPDGMALMAVELAERLAGARSEASRVALRLENDGRVATTGKVDVKRFDRMGLEAIVTADALPWVLPATGEVGPAPWNYLDDPSEGFRLALEGRSLNRDTLEVSGLESGVYEIVMDGKVVLIADSDALVRGIPLQQVENAPGHRQSLELARLNAQRNALAVRPYRDAQARMKSARRKFAAGSRELAAVRAEVDAEIRELHALALKWENEIHELAVPRPYRLQVRRFTR